MSNKNRSGKPFTKAVSALCLLTAGTATGEGIAPRLVKMTEPVRVEPFPAATAPPSVRSEDAGRNHGIKQTAGGLPRTNQFVELGSEEFVPDAKAATLNPLSATRSAAVPQRYRPQRGPIQNNPLIVDAPPKLRQFGVDERPSRSPATRSGGTSTGVLVARKQPLPARSVEDMDQTFEALSVAPSQTSSLRGTARNNGFGMLAIDQLGNHLGQPSSACSVTNYPPLPRLSTDLVLPDPPAARSQSTDPSASFHHAADPSGELSLIEENTPPLPAPADDRVAAAVAQALTAFQQQSGGRAEAPNANFASDVPGQIPLEVEQLLAASAERSDQAVDDVEPAPEKETRKPSLGQRLASWSKGLTTKTAGDRPSEDRVEAEALPPKRSGGILTQWFNRSR